MKRLLIVLLSTTLHAATYYVSSTGNDSNAGSSGSPWLSVGQSVLKMGCGDTLMVVANGSYVSGDANLPYFANCNSTTSIQSSKLDQFRPAGYRTNPATDSAAYGKLLLGAQGINATVEHHGAGACLISALSSNTFTLAFCNGFVANMANGQQILFQLDSQGFNSFTSTSSNLTILQKYYVINCSSCGATGGTFQVAATPGGQAIATNCTGTCNVGALNLVQPLQVNTSASTITSPDALVGMSNGTPIYFSASGLQLNTLTTPTSALPAPLQLDTKYFIVNLSSRTFQVATSPGGTPITLTTIGTGPFKMSDARAPNNWAFRGLELKQDANRQLQGFVFGDGSETSVNGMVHHMEVDRCWIHEHATDEGTAEGLTRGIADNAAFGNYHDNYIAGMSRGEAQAIQGTGSPGPTLILNNFLEASGENTLYGGNWPSSGISNANKLFQGNYFYKPPAWKITNTCFGGGACTGAASGSCWYDATDPNHAGGEWYRSAAGQNYRCGSNGQWATTGASLPATLYTVKNMAEHKSGRYFTYSGNVFNYSWVSAQTGQVFLFAQEEGSGPGIANDHITAINNKASHYNNFATFISHCVPLVIPCQSTLLPREYAITNNIGTSDKNACGLLFSTTPQSCQNHAWTFEYDGYGATDLLWNHNTLVSGDGLSYPWDVVAAYFTGGITAPGGQLLDRWIYKNSIAGYDFAGDSASCGSVIATYFTHSVIDRIANPNNTCASYTSVGATNTFTNRSARANFAAVGFTDLAGGDYHLTTSSPFSAGCSSGCSFTADDGTDLGADVDLVNMATSGVLAGTPPWDVQAGLQVTTGSTKLVFKYQAPTAAACTATIYSAPARISGNQAASVADSAASSISDGLARQLYISGLTASRHYWYKLACGGGVLLVGDVFTRAAGSGTSQFTFDWNAPTAMQYSSSANMSSAVSLPPATRQFIPVAANSVVYAQAGAGGPITILIAP
jgi:hypothetical protein